MSVDAPNDPVGQARRKAPRWMKIVLVLSLMLNVVGIGAVGARAWMVHKHGHNSDHILFVLEGEVMCGDVKCTKGMHVTLEHGAAFGPFIAGPEGVELFEIMMGDPRSWAADPEGFEKLLAERNAVKLPNPPIDLPDWLEDTRTT